MNWIERKINNHYSHYDDKKYWNLKFLLQREKTNIVVRCYAMLKLKKMLQFFSRSL